MNIQDLQIGELTKTFINPQGLPSCFGGWLSIIEDDDLIGMPLEELDAIVWEQAKQSDELPNFTRLYLNNTMQLIENWLVSVAGCDDEDYFIDYGGGGYATITVNNEFIRNKDDLLAILNKAAA